MKPMQKIIFTAILLSLLICSLSAFGQQKKDIYAKSSPIVKILAHKLGYQVYFIRQDATLGNFYVPIEWFRKSVGKGAIIWGNEPSYPYFTIVYEEKKFSYVKLFLKEDARDNSWGVLRAEIDEVKDKFNLESLEIEF
ncbi:MAG TPA: hypothetical protein VMX75_11895 [Spirochaetia bacterium]|nr:hypothetical protein [Spirochaetia bacterium]